MRRLLLLLTFMAAADLVAAVKGLPPLSECRTNLSASAWCRTGERDISCSRLTDGRYLVRHAGKRDWSFNGFKEFQPVPEIRYEVSYSVETAPLPDGTSSGKCRAGFVARFADGRIDYGYLNRTLRPGERCEIRTNLPPDVVRLVPRVTGAGPFAGVIGPCVFRQTGRYRGVDASAKVAVENETLSLSVDPRTLAISVTDRRTGRVWAGDASARWSGIPAAWKLLAVRRPSPRSLELLLGEGGEPTKSFLFELEGAEIAVTLDFGRETPIKTLRYPQPFATRKGDRLIVPYNEGMGYPVDEEHQSLLSAPYACGFRMSMHFFGVIEDASGAGQMTIVESPEDGTMEIYRLGAGKLYAAGPGWLGEFGKASYPRRLRLVFFDQGGHVAQAKRFRAYAKANGWLKTFEEKAIQRPKVKLLPGAPNIWVQRIRDEEKPAHAKELKALGVNRFLWSSGGSAETVKAIAAMDGVLIGRYDCTQDVYHPSLMAHMGRPGQLGTGGEAWPQDVMWTGDTPDTWRKAWGIEIKEGTNTVMDYCATMCDVKAPFYEYERVREELKTHPYTARFLDTAFSEPWKECANPAHRQTRRESHAWRKELLRMLTERFGLVTGSERGSCSGVPVADYFEGMMSISFCGVPRAGRDICITWTNKLPGVVTRYQVGAQYRLPLWELVFHDCCCAHWYWGDTQNKTPEIWDRRTLFNVLYATSPVFLYTKQQWPQIREHVAATCRATIPIGRRVGFSEMTDHRFLTPDRLVQRTLFANGTEITVNFSDREWTDADGRKVAPGAWSVATVAPPAAGPLIVSRPFLQNAAETSMGVGFAVSALANGYVKVSKSPDLADARVVKCGGYRVTDLNDKVMLVRLTGLEPATTYYYRIGADRIDYGGGYEMRILGREEDPTVYSFTTLGTAARASFCVISDTHRHWPAFQRALDKIDELEPSCVVWNGDAYSVAEDMETLVSTFYTPKVRQADYASRRPYLFVPGNHESRGFAARHLERVLMFRQPEERNSRDWDLGRNFAVRCGELALIGLDTGEDKRDDRDKFAGLFNMEPYREAQAVWLKDALARPDIRDAPYLVAFCHIPLFDPDPTHNPGDLPNDGVGTGQYAKDYASWQRTCARLWGPLLAKAGCQLVVAGHQHRYRFDAADAGRPWAQVVCGGRELGFVRTVRDGRSVNVPSADRFPTVVEGRVGDGRLSVRVHDVYNGRVAGEFSFPPRRCD